MNPCPKHPENSYLTNFHMSTNLARTGNNKKFMRIERLAKLNSIYITSAEQLKEILNWNHFYKASSTRFWQVFRFFLYLYSLRPWNKNRIWISTTLWMWLEIYVSTKTWTCPSSGLVTLILTTRMYVRVLNNSAKVQDFDFALYWDWNAQLLLDLRGFGIE